MRAPSIQRGAIALAVLGALTLAVIASPVGAAKKPVTKQKAKTIATNTFNTLFPASFNSMFSASFNSMFPASFTSAIGGANKQDACANGTVFAYAYIRGADLTAGFSTSGVTHSFNCAGGAIDARRNSTGDYDVRVPGITTPAIADSDSIVASLTPGNDTPRYASYETSVGDDFVAVDVFDGSAAPVDAEVAIVIYNNP